jgi:hypothetical protein
VIVHNLKNLMIDYDEPEYWDSWFSIIPEKVYNQIRPIFINTTDTHEIAVLNFYRLCWKLDLVSWRAILNG